MASEAPDILVTDEAMYVREEPVRRLYEAVSAFGDAWADYRLGKPGAGNRMADIEAELGEALDAVREFLVG